MTICSPPIIDKPDSIWDSGRCRIGLRPTRDHVNTQESDYKPASPTKGLRANQKDGGGHHVTRSQNRYDRFAKVVDVPMIVLTILWLPFNLLMYEVPTS